MITKYVDPHIIAAYTFTHYIAPPQQQQQQVWCILKKELDGFNKGTRQKIKNKKNNNEKM